MREDESDYSDSESDEEEDDEGELLTPAVDAQILKTLSEIRFSFPKKFTIPIRNSSMSKSSPKSTRNGVKKHSSAKKNTLKPDSKPKMTVRDYQ